MCNQYQSLFYLRLSIFSRFCLCICITLGLTFVDSLGSRSERVIWAASTESTAQQNGIWPYRVLLTIDANGYERTDKVADISIDFTQLLNQVGETAAFDDVSIRVVEVDTNDNIVDADVPFQFDKDTAYNAASNAAGLLVLQISGTTPANGVRYYHVYFGPVGETYAQPTTNELITTTTSGVQDEGANSYKFEMASGTYFYQHQHGGFSSIDDVDGNDWINHSSATGTAGEFRGIPNLIYPGGGFHPGYGGSTTQIEHIGPLKVTYLTTDGNWQARWEIYPEYVRMTVLQTDHDYWFLYEGTPGGELTTSDRYVLSSGPTQYNAYWDSNNSTDPDIPNEEWIYFSDSNVGPAGRSLFLAHHEDDTFSDSYRRLGTTGNNNAMTVFGFGRQHLSTLMSQVPQHFTFGLLETVDYTEASTAINAAYQDLSISIGVAENSVIDSTPGTVTLVSPLDSSVLGTPTFEWLATPAATEYTLVVYDVTLGTIRHSQTFAGSSICAGTTCLVQPSVSLLTGLHTWLIKAENSLGNGPWTTGFE